jgi:hypothetical protein
MKVFVREGLNGREMNRDTLGQVKPSHSEDSPLLMSNLFILLDFLAL